MQMYHVLMMLAASLRTIAAGVDKNGKYGESLATAIAALESLAKFY